MKILELVSQLNSITVDQIQEMGQDINGNPIFALRIGDSVGSFIVGDLDIMDFPEWLTS